MSTRKLCSALFLILVFGLLCGACAPTKYYQRRKLADRCMVFDADGRLVFIRNKMEAAREGSFGGFGGASAGGCGCQ